MNNKQFVEHDYVYRNGKKQRVDLIYNFFFQSFFYRSLKQMERRNIINNSTSRAY